MNQKIIEVTGEIGVGKTYAVKRLADLARKKGRKAFHLDLDRMVVHEILDNLPGVVYKKARQEIFGTFGERVKGIGQSIDRKALGEIVFDDHKKLEILMKIMREPIKARIQEKIKEKDGLIFLDAALFAEYKMLALSRNRVILVICDTEIQKKRLAERGYEPEQIKRRIRSQYNFDLKKRMIEKQIEKDGYGRLWVFKNNSAKELDESLARILEEI